MDKMGTKHLVMDKLIVTKNVNVTQRVNTSVFIFDANFVVWVAGSLICLSVSSFSECIFDYYIIHLYIYTCIRIESD